MQIPLADDRLPSDPGMRSIAVRALGLAYHVIRMSGSYGNSPEHLAHSLWPRPKDEHLRRTAPAIVAALVEGGFLAIEKPDQHRRVVRFVRGVAGSGEREETGLGRLEALAQSLARRCSSDPATQGKVCAAFLGFRALNAVVSTWGGTLELTSRGKPDPRPGFLFPSAFRMDPVTGPALAGAFLILRMPGGRLVGRNVPQEACRAETDGYAAKVSVDVAACEPWDAGGVKLADLAVTPLRFRKLHPYFPKLTTPDWKPLGRERKAASAYFGPDLDPLGWRRFVASVGRGRGGATHVARHLHELVEPEIRAACARDPQATVGLANWLCGRSAELRRRRLQASAAYPFLTGQMRRFGKVVDAGEPLAPAISGALGLPPRMVRHLRGVHWQALGKARENLVAGSHGADRISKVVLSIPPERLPRGKKPWQDFVSTVSTVFDTLAWPAPAKVLAEASADWSRLPAMKSAGLSHAIADMVKAVASALDIIWRDKQYDDATRAVVAAIVGEGGLGRLDRFNADWHRHANAILAVRREVERDAWGDAPTAWLPLTPRPFQAEGGRIEWLTDRAALADEGLAMAHCVAGRDYACLFEASHVGAVHGREGGRSTVEVALRQEPGKDRPGAWWVDVWEHKGVRNAAAAQDCALVVEALARKGTPLGDHAEVLQARTERRKWLADRDGDNLLPEHRERILAAYDACLPKDVRGLGSEGWRTRILAAAGKEAAETGRRRRSGYPAQRPARMPFAQGFAAQGQDIPF